MDVGPACLQQVLDLLDFGVVLLDSDGNLSFANHVAVQECGSGGALLLQGGRVDVRARNERVAFQSALQAAQRGLRSMINLKAADGLKPIVVTPLTTDGSNDGTPPLILIMLARQPEGTRLTVEMFAQSHYLTVAETIVLRGLCQGKTPRGLAQSLNVAICTIRTHIGNIRHKTGDANIRGLITQVQGLPPLAPARTFYSPLSVGAKDTGLTTAGAFR